MEEVMPHQRWGTFVSLLSRPVSWEWILTAVLIGLAAVTLLTIADLQRIAEIGEFISGFSAALAFLWLIVGLRSQAADLKLQRQELALQRAVLEKQAKELKNTSKFTSLAQIDAILMGALAKLKESPAGVKEPKDIASAWMAGMKSWKMMFESKDADLVTKSYQEWIMIEGAARSYLAHVALALKLYMEHHLEVASDAKLPNDEFIYVYSSWGNNAPFLSEHVGSAYMIANLVFLYGPGLKALQTASMFAMKKMAGADIFKEGALEHMRQELIDKDITVPAIARES